MGFYISHRFGGDDSDPPLSSISPLLAELDDHQDDYEHPDVSVTHDSEWSIGAFVSGKLVIEHLEGAPGGEPRHLLNVTRDEAEGLMAAVAQGHIDEVLAQPWIPGYS